ncbi:UDP-N-acetylglucosamine--N-acetylmuramyl-(Pentapeptide) pyrophosphoryl-undecaprenol N-acetylglucosamine transferase [Elysia marginata]|uniref:UDP-N-acetylglucosamine--N-acetylmuramyl-(Pentapeptide) pyrophosphoryl-undecaprenol N-acetylglucosamine transferase n=1 Tax=Elysia marginata TaxID=1093978 RepID=A0AAV4HSV6_9GAST|nr:UDP-N-acetylglucosamine--N-acetylmuramyl-(Pentapeptide) pyrophosphoryl-undecaprenol N-acetylglucosamine transferase [Elysia marginata]
MEFETFTTRLGATGIVVNSHKFIKIKEKIEETFVNVIMEDAPLDERCGRFADYILRNYIDSALSDFPHPDFPPEIWTGTGTGNTTNSCESFHRYFGGNFTSPHPNIYKFIEGLQNEQKIIIIKRQSIVNPVCKRKQKLRKEKKMSELSRQYEEGELTCAEILDQMSKRMLPAHL